MDATTKAPRPTEAQHDETPSGITDHAFEPRGEWWTLCKHCTRAEAAHAETTVRLIFVTEDITVEEDV